jgi:hypothetical protein
VSAEEKVISLLKLQEKPRSTKTDAHLREGWVRKHLMYLLKTFSL